MLAIGVSDAIEAVTMMDRILKSVETDPLCLRLMDTGARPEAPPPMRSNAPRRASAPPLQPPPSSLSTQLDMRAPRASGRRVHPCLTPNLHTTREGAHLGVIEHGEDRTTMPWVQRGARRRKEIGGASAG
jgi:hypothetical protein